MGPVHPKTKSADSSATNPRRTRERYADTCQIVCRAAELALSVSVKSPYRWRGSQTQRAPRLSVQGCTMSSPELYVTGHTAHFRCWHVDHRRLRWWQLDRRWCQRDRWWRCEGASQTCCIARHDGALGIKWAGGKRGRWRRCGRALPIWTALTYGVTGRLQASGIIRTRGSAIIGVVLKGRRTGHACNAGPYVCRDGHPRRRYCDKCSGHGYFRHHAADARWGRPVHPSLLCCGPTQAALHCRCQALEYCGMPACRR